MRHFATILCVWWLHGVVAFAADPPSVPVRKAKSAAIVPTDAIEEFSVPRYGDVLILPVKVEGQVYQFAVDTGSPTIMLDSVFKSKLVPTGQSLRSKFGRTLELYQMPSASLGDSGLAVEGEAACIDMSGFREASGHDLRGILGMNFLRSRAIRIDFDAGKFAFLNSVERAAGTPFKLSQDDFKRPTLQVELAADRPLSMCIDTGMVSPGFGELRTAVFEVLMDDGRLAVAGSQVRTATYRGDVKARKGILDLLQISEFQHKHVGVREGTINAIGLGYLSRFVVTFDFPNHMMYLKKGKRFDKATPYDMSGLAVAHVNGDVVISQIQDGSPSETAGLREGDILSSVNGRPAEQYSLFELRHLLAVDGSHALLTVQRSKETLNFDLVLSNWQRIQSSEE